jgi:hypothetical protein
LLHLTDNKAVVGSVILPHAAIVKLFGYFTAVKYQQINEIACLGRLQQATEQVIIT